jgi:hypothetical protein
MIMSRLIMGGTGKVGQGTVEMGHTHTEVQRFDSSTFQLDSPKNPQLVLMELKKERAGVVQEMDVPLFARSFLLIVPSFLPVLYLFLWGLRRDSTHASDITSHL